MRWYVPGYKTPFPGNLIGTKVRQRERDRDEGMSQWENSFRLLSSSKQVLIGRVETLTRVLHVFNI